MNKKEPKTDWLGRKTGTTKAYGNTVVHPPKAQPNRGGGKKAK